MIAFQWNLHYIIYTITLIIFYTNKIATPFVLWFYFVIVLFYLLRHFRNCVLNRNILPEICHKRPATLISSSNWRLHYLVPLGNPNLMAPISHQTRADTSYLAISKLIPSCIHPDPTQSSLVLYNRFIGIINLYFLYVKWNLTRSHLLLVWMRRPKSLVN